MALNCLRSQLRRGLNPKCFRVAELKGSRQVSTETTSPKERWDLFSAVCLERKPVTTPELNPMEKKFSDMLKQVEFEQSLLSDHELRHKQDLIQADLLRRGEETDVEQTLKQTAQDFEDACQEEINTFKFANRVTELKDERSLQRKLDRSIVLVVKQKLGKDFVWTMPQGKRSEGETMRQAAERALKENAGDTIEAKFMGNAPCGFYMYKYPKAMRKENSPVGAKIFFFKAVHKNGQVEVKKVDDFKWLGREELGGTLPAAYNKSVGQFLIDE